MLKGIIVVASCLLLPCAAWAQDELIKDYSNEHLENFIKVDLKKNFKEQENHVYTIVGAPYFANLDLKRKVVFFFWIFDNNKYAKPITADMLNTWNKRAFYSRAYFDKEDGKTIRIEGSLDFSAGVTRNQVKSIFAKFDEETTRLQKDFGELKEKAPQQKKLPDTETLSQGFPHGAGPENKVDLAKHDTGWDIEWDFVPVEQNNRTTKLQLFRIVKATFKWKDSKGAHKSLVVLRNLYLAEAFAQYDDKKTCWLDIAMVTSTVNVPASKEFLGPGCVGVGSILPSNKTDFANKVHKELHYDGLRWMSIYGKTQNDLEIRTRKGEKLALWAAIRSGNYAYLMEYNFTDDGRIVSRLGFTAHNFFNRVDNGNDVHAHLGCWRFEFSLSDPDKKEGGYKDNKISIVRRVFDKNKRVFKIELSPFPGKGNTEALEGSAEWIAKQFTTLRAESSTVINRTGKGVAYDLVSTRTGTAADLLPIHNAAGLDMGFVNYDFWVTKTPKGYKHYHKVPELAQREVPIKGEPTTVWHSVAGLHVPRDEDFGPDGDKMGNAGKGAALTEWISFTLRPRNLFDSTPLYAPAK
jgi:hypothetical protein